MAILVAFAVSPTHSSSAESFGAAAIKWHDADALPLLVWVQPAPRVDGSPMRMDENVRAAFAAWSSVASIAFDVSSDSAIADVRVHWSKLALLDSDGDAVNALTHCEVDDYSRIVRADIVVATRRANGGTLSPDALSALLMHEVGHALGLEHSPNSSSIMFSTVQVDGLSSADVAAVRALYGESTTRTALFSRR